MRFKKLDPKKIFVCAALGAGLMGPAAFAYSADDAYVTVEDFTHPRQDALKAFTEYDLKFIAVGGGASPETPGVDKRTADLYGFRMMRGTQSALISGEKRPTRVEALLYAAAFNQELAGFISLKKTK
jgi:hypothetical protein